MDVTISSLWLPILLSGIAVFLASFVMWMVLPHHRTDWSKLPDEEGFRAAMHRLNIPTGQYIVPHCASPKEMASPEWTKKVEEGPVAYMYVRPNEKHNMGKALTLSFLFTVVVAVFAAYLATRTLDASTPYLQVFRVIGTVTFLTYCGAFFWDAIWQGKSWSSTFKSVADSLLYSLLSAGFFGWLWPR